MQKVVSWYLFVCVSGFLPQFFWNQNFQTYERRRRSNQKHKSIDSNRKIKW